MITLNELSKIAKGVGISSIGATKARVLDELLIHLEDKNTPFCASAKERIDPFLLLPNAKSIIMCAFNYNDGENGNVARYAHGRDYHTVVKERLQLLCSSISKQAGKFDSYIFCDNSPMCDKHLGYICGLGTWGRQSLLINPAYGTYFVLGGIICDVEVEESKQLDDLCCGCNACAEACPGKAISDKGVDTNRCVSHILQRKGEFDKQQIEWIQKSGMVWGCDECQKACPYNKNLSVTDIAEFLEKPVYNLGMDMLGCNREFNERFYDKAFTWRGVAAIRRNLEIYKKK